MLLPPEVRRKLAVLRQGAEEKKSPQRQAGPVGDEIVIAPRRQMPSGRETHHKFGRYLSIRQTPDEIGEWAEELARAAFASLAYSKALPIERRHRVAFLDIETTSLSSTPLFLVGILHVGDCGVHIHQLLARDYTEESAVLAATADLLSEVRVLVSFNGRSFDMPYLRDRARYHRMNWPTQPERHVDMLHIARRQRGLDVPNHRLVTLETRLCRRRREADIPGEEIPAAYHRFVETGQTEELALILHHNQIDLLTTMELAARWPEGHSSRE